MTTGTPPVKAYAPDDFDFPNNVVKVLHDRYSDYLKGVGFVGMRPLRRSDPQVSISIFSSDWVPTDINIGQMDPAVSRYTYVIQCFVKDGDEERGLRGHATLSKRARSMLYRDTVTKLALSALTVTDSVSHLTERFQRHGVRQQRFVSNEMQGTYLYLSIIEYWVETETV